MEKVKKLTCNITKKMIIFNSIKIINIKELL